MGNVTTNRTVAEHTESCPGKERVRRDRIDELQSDRRRAQGVVSISDALLPTLFIKRHGGPFQGIDCEKAMCDAIDNHRPRPNKPEGNYPGIDIRPAMHMDACDAVRLICQRGEYKQYGLWDFDLTANIKTLFNFLMLPILEDLAECRSRAMIVITACVRHDGFSSFLAREAYIRLRLPDGIGYVKHDNYSSNYYDRHRQYHRRAPMCQFILRGTG